MAIALARVDEGAIRPTREYQSLLADCREIRERGRQSLLMHYWELGERIAQELPEEREDRYGQGIILALEQDLAADRKTLWRAVQLYRTYSNQALSPHGDNAWLLTWSKVRMLLPLPEEMRKEIQQRILSGELRTDDQVRLAIHEGKQVRGLLPPSPLGEAEPDILGVKGINGDKLRTLWRRASFRDRAVLARALLKEMDWAHVARAEALFALRLIGQTIEECEQDIEASHSGNRKGRSDEGDAPDGVV